MKLSRRELVKSASLGGLGLMLGYALGMRSVSAQAETKALINLKPPTTGGKALRVLNTSDQEVTILYEDGTIETIKLKTDAIEEKTSGGGINLGDGALFVDQVNKRIGVKNASPRFELDVDGSLWVRSRLYIPAIIFGAMGNCLQRALVHGSVSATGGSNPPGAISEGATSSWNIPDTETLPVSLTIDLGTKIYRVEQFVLRADWYNAEHIPQGFRIEISDDGSSWTTIAEVSGGSLVTGDGYYEQNSWIFFGSWSFRYVKVTVTEFGTAGDAHVKIYAYITLFDGYSASGAEHLLAGYIAPYKGVDKLYFRRYGTDVMVIDFANKEIRPPVDNQGSIGTDSYRWALVRAVTITSGDYVFENGWRLTEAEKLGLGEGIVLVDKEGNVRKVWA